MDSVLKKRSLSCFIFLHLLPCPALSHPPVTQLETKTFTFPTLLFRLSKRKGWTRASADEDESQPLQQGCTGGSSDSPTLNRGHCHRCRTAPSKLPALVASPGLHCSCPAVPCTLPGLSCLSMKNYVKYFLKMKVAKSIDKLSEAVTL